MSEQPEELPAPPPLKKIECYDMEANYLFDIETTEPLQPHASFFYQNGDKYMTLACDLIPINQAEDELLQQGGNAIVEYKAVVKQVDEMGIGANDPNHTTQSKIFSKEAAAKQAEINHLADLDREAEEILQKDKIAEMAATVAELKAAIAAMQAGDTPPPDPAP